MLYLTIIKDGSCNCYVYVQSVYLAGGFEILPTFVQICSTSGSRCCIAFGLGWVAVLRASSDRGIWFFIVIGSPGVRSGHPCVPIVVELLVILSLC